MVLIDKQVGRGRRTASRIWGKTAIVLLLPRGNAEPESKEELFELSPSGTAIWRLLEKRPRVKELIADFAQENKISPNSAKSQVLSFIQKLAQDKLVDILP